MANITRIKAKDSEPETEHKPPKPKSNKSAKTAENPQTALSTHGREGKSAKSQETKTQDQTEPKTKSKDKAKADAKKPFLLFRPFVALGAYLLASWRELRQVRWPNRSTTWKMVLAVFLYTLVFTAFLVALDILFDFIFSKILA